MVVEDGRWILILDSYTTPQSLVILRKNNEDDNTIINSSQTKPYSSLSLSANLSVASCCFRHFYSRQCSALPDKIQTCPTPFHHHTDNSDLVRSYKDKTSAMLVALNCEKLCERERDDFYVMLLRQEDPPPFIVISGSLRLRISKDGIFFQIERKINISSTQKKKISVFKLLSFSVPSSRVK